MFSSVSNRSIYGTLHQINIIVFVVIVIIVIQFDMPLPIRYDDASLKDE